MAGKKGSRSIGQPLEQTVNELVERVGVIEDRLHIKPPVMTLDEEDPPPPPPPPPPDDPPPGSGGPGEP